MSKALIVFPIAVWIFAQSWVEKVGANNLFDKNAREHQPTQHSACAADGRNRMLQSAPVDFSNEEFSLDHKAGIRLRDTFYRFGRGMFFT